VYVSIFFCFKFPEVSIKNMNEKVIATSILAFFFFIYLLLNFSYTGFASSSSQINLWIIFTFLLISLAIILFFSKKKEEKITEKSGVKEAIERKKFLQEYDIRKYLPDLRNSIDYVGKLYGEMKEKFNKIGYLESKEREELEENLERTEEILDLLHRALDYLKEGKDYLCVADVEDAWRISETLSYSNLKEKLGNLALKLRETYTLGRIKEQEKKFQ
jgi:Ca2+/Na+ antiporter